jgi:fatty-acyl-CoA synthase
LAAANHFENLSMRLQTFRTLADIEALERTPYAQAIPAQTTYGLIANAARHFGERDALRYIKNDDLDAPVRCVSYASLLAQIHRAANLFRTMGVGPGDAVAILAPNIPETQFALWGAQISGIACPINYLLQPDHIAALLVASKAKVIVALGLNDELDLWSTVEKVLALQALPVLQIRVNDQTAPGVPVFQDQLALHSDVLGFDPQLTPDRIAACFHTGGTTGAPKLAQHSHGNEAHTSWFAHGFYGFDEHSVTINGFPLFHVAGAFVFGLSMLAIGATQVLPTLSGMRNTAFVKKYWKFCQRERVTALVCVPTVLATLVNLPVDVDLSGVQVAYTGGSPLPGELAAQFEAKLGIPVRNIFGMTECAGLVSIEPFAAPRVSGSTGLRLPYTQVHAVAWRDGAAQLNQHCEAGETGVMVLRGPHISPGYTDAARDEGMFQTDSQQTRWLVSGDLGHIDVQGCIHITGRAKDVIIRGSHNIDPGLVEDAFLAHPAVAMCAVVGEPDAYAGELPVAFVTLKPGAQCDSATLLAEVAPHVYERPASPKRVTILEAMPTTAIGKIYKPALRLRAMETKLTEMLLDVPGATVKGIEQGAALTAQILIASKGDALLERQLRARLAAIAVKMEFVFTGV